MGLLSVGRFGADPRGPPHPHIDRPVMSWWQILMRALELFKALVEKLNKTKSETETKSVEEKKPLTINERIAKQNEQIARQKKLYKRNHPNG